MGETTTEHILGPAGPASAAGSGNGAAASNGHAADPERALWQRFAVATAPREFCQSWLPLQCRMLEGVRCAMVLLGAPDAGPFSPAAVWPDSRMGMKHLSGAAERSLKERRGVLLSREEAEPEIPEDLHIAYPIEVEGRIHGTIVLGVDGLDEAGVQQFMRRLHWGVGWIEVLIRRTEATASQQVRERLQSALELLASAVEHERFQEACMALVTRIANQLGCDRVSIGFTAGGSQARVTSVSHSADFGRQTNLTRAIEAAMDEALDQRAVVVHPATEDEAPLVQRAHADLARQHGCGASCTIPLESGAGAIGALTLERPADHPFDTSTVELCQTVGGIAGPILETRRLEERWLARKAVDSLAGFLRRLLGRGHLIHKLVAIALVLVTVVLATYDVDYRVTAPTVIEGAVQRAVAAPFDGYVDAAPARPGDVVEAGQLLARLDDRDLRLEREKWRTERERFVRERREAVAAADRSQGRILQARIDQADAQIHLLDEQLARCRLEAPFTGVVLSGDLSQSLGAPVGRGEILFEVAPLDSFRVVAEVDERDVADIAPGQHSDLVVSSIPDRAFPFEVVQVTPVTISEDGRSYFRVEGRLLQPAADLRPGMEGIGKITVEPRRLAWVWGHEIVDWLRLQLWRWRP